MTNQISLELVGVARYQLEELLETLPDTTISAGFESLFRDLETSERFPEATVHSIFLATHWTDSLDRTLSFDLRDLTAAKLRHFLEEVPGTAEIYPQLILQTADELLDFPLSSGKLIIEWEDSEELKEPIEPLDLDEEEDWDGEVGHWVQELEAEASRTEDPELRAAHRRQIGLLLGLADYAARYEDLNH